MRKDQKTNGMKRLFSYLKKYRASLFFVCLFAVISTLFTVLAPSIMGEITTTLFDGATTGVFNWNLIVILLLSLAALYLVAQLFAFLQNFGMARTTARINAEPAKRYRSENAPHQTELL